VRSPSAETFRRKIRVMSIEIIEKAEERLINSLVQPGEKVAVNLRGTLASQQVIVSGQVPKEEEVI
jgi:hypothetical protein